MKISTSILNVKKEESTRIFYELEVAKTDFFHIDVMDGKFVKNNTAAEMKEYSTIVKHISNLPLDVHLMVENTREFIDEYLDLNPNYITIHFESYENKEELLKDINYIKQNNTKVGLSIKPNTDITKIYDFLPYIHLVLTMTVEPGYGGQVFMENQLEKIEKLKKYINENDLEIDIEADGGINKENIGLLKKAGVDISVVGSYIINAENFEKTITELKEIKC